MKNADKIRKHQSQRVSQRMNYLVILRRHALLVAGVGQPRVHVRHHLDLQILDQLQLVGVEAGQSRWSCRHSSIEFKVLKHKNRNKTVFSLTRFSFSVFGDQLLLDLLLDGFSCSHLILPLRDGDVTREDEGGDAAEDERSPGARKLIRTDTQLFSAPTRLNKNAASMCLAF